MSHFDLAGKILLKMADNEGEGEGVGKGWGGGEMFGGQTF